MSNILEEIEKANLTKASLPSIQVGDSIAVSRIIIEGKKQRNQKFEGVVVKKKGRLSRENITVRKIVDQVGIEFTFLVHSSLISDIKVLKTGKVRRARLHYLRERIGAKANRIKSAAE